MSSPNSDIFSLGEGSMPQGLNFETTAGLAEILQACCLSRRTGQITFLSGESSGFVYLQHGRVIHAVCGMVEGDEAVYHMLGWNGGRFSLNEEILPQSKTVDSSWEQLLLEGARRADQGPETPPPTGTKPVVTSAPVTSSRVRASLPKIIVLLPDERPRVYELEAEYTHLGRAPGNEIPLSDASVSNRHCIFIVNGSDVVLRDLNSSNGTVVNGQTISEVILQTGDVIQAGIVQMKFETAVRRPKLTQTLGAGNVDRSELSAVTGSRESSRSTIKLPQARTVAPEPEVVKDDSVFVKGESAISYGNLAKPEVPSSGRSFLFVIAGAIVILALLGGCYYYFMVLPH
jgi:pSer/pThr/pTyr-binding forkhead associated (FHA) protein